MNPKNYICICMHILYIYIYIYINKTRYRFRWLAHSPPQRAGPSFRFSLSLVIDLWVLSVINAGTRASFFRRSICAIRKSVGRRPRKKDKSGFEIKLFFFDFVASRVEFLFTLEFISPNFVYQVLLFHLPRKNFVYGEVKTDSHILPHYRFQEGFSVRPSRSNEKFDISTCGPLCLYSGFGRAFERINPGEEITITVFGRRGVGKTSLVRRLPLIFDPFPITRSRYPRRRSEMWI
uniref:ATP-binding protein n=1 Tax=Angiostrongylus cantonensis TaxID=6313 RepID=A0A158PB72_ANGCA